jgi:hypothetical protein
MWLPTPATLFLWEGVTHVLDAARHARRSASESAATPAM